ncbi:uncharacterized protein LOC110049583 [Orbicella faveolata]|uniref:uncharacterized protein LOC110049583 n=1 Tax=Orbicella faveolata TaxID=48498 RepID=UPI0009E27DE7|nr:uncharacterized protein LOC110049583 [Orbicella faveolata]
MHKGCVLLSRWLPDEIEGHSRGDLFQEFNKQCGTVDFTYSSAKELHELVRLHHEVQLLSLQLHVRQLGGEKLLPLLEPEDGSIRQCICTLVLCDARSSLWRWQGFSSHGP